MAIQIAKIRVFCFGGIVSIVGTRAMLALTDKKKQLLKC